MTRLSIIIRCYNEEEHIGRLLSGIMKQSEKEVEIIIVDSGSTDQTVNIAKQFPIKLVSIQPEQFSFGRSLNLGCRVANGDILVFASAHVYPVYDDWLAELLAPFQDNSVALVYGCQRGNEVTKFSEHQIFARWFPSESNFKQEHPFCNNANVAIRKSLWEELPYDERLTGLEDIAWAKEILARGHLIAYNAKAEIIHVHDETASRVFNRYRREAIAMKTIFPDADFTFWSFLKLFVKNTIADYYYSVKEQSLFENFSDIFKFRLMQFWGTFKGYQQKNLTIGVLRQTLYYPRDLRANKTPSEADIRVRKAINYKDSSKVTT
ncbi:MAG: glycosyltransferase [Chloroflexota bacterium]